MSYDNSDYGSGFSSLELAAGAMSIMSYPCDCGKCSGCKELRERVERLKLKQRYIAEAESARFSARFKEGTKAVAGLSWNKQIKLALIHKVHQDGLDSAIIQYMAKEALPAYYAAILKSHQCIDRLVQGILCKVCHIRTNLALDEQIGELSSTVRNNPDFLSPYDRVTQIQQFIHRTADQYLGEGAACLIPVSPMKNALSAARLHLSIFDVMHHHPVYAAYLDELSRAASRLEYDEPRPFKNAPGKHYYPRWRVRHLRPLSYFYTPARFSIIEALMNVDENIASNDFVDEALRIYAAYHNDDYLS